MLNIKLNNLEEMVLEYVEKGSKITETFITNLTAPGDNYGSQIHKIDIKVEGKNGELQDLHIVAKQIPESEFFQDIFNVQITFKLEGEFYKTILPTLNSFRAKNELAILEAFPKFYGAGNNLHGTNNIIDRDALIILENLKIGGYTNVDRTVGFDLETSKIILKELAQFHATALALKLKEPKIFETTIKPYCYCFLEPSKKPEFNNETNILLEFLYKSKAGRAISDKLETSLRYRGTNPETFREPFATLVHTDFWVNNIMVKSEKGVINSAKIVDFQMYSYNSPAKDLIFFLFTSVETTALKQNLDNLITYYYETFIKVLTDFKCDTTPFSYNNFLKEITASMKYELGNTLFMLLFIIRGPKGGHAAGDTFSTAHLKPEDKERVYWLLEEIEKRGWTKF